MPGMGVKFGIKDVDKGYKKLLKQVLGMRAAEVRVGVFEKDGVKVHDSDGTYPVTVADVATWNEFGTNTIPERSFIRGYFDENQKKTRVMVRVICQQVVKGAYTIEVGLERFGLKVQGDIQKRMATRGVFEPLAQSTIDRKGSTMPLIDTGVLRSSITYFVKWTK